MGTRLATFWAWAMVVLLLSAAGTARAEETGLLTLAVGATGVDEAKPAAAEEAVEPVERDVRVITGMGLGMLSATGDAKLAGRSADVDASFSDILDHLDLAAMPSVEVGIKKWSIIFNGMFARLEGEKDNTVLGDVDVTADMGGADLALAYRLWEFPRQGEESRDMVLTLEPEVGFRYTYLSLDINTDAGDADGHKDWWDPYVGGRATLKINEQLGWRNEGTIGGFGVGSDLTWSAGTYLDWQAFKRVGFNVGYRAVSWDFEDGRFAWDVTFHGPWLGLRVTW